MYIDAVSISAEARTGILTYGELSNPGYFLGFTKLPSHQIHAPSKTALTGDETLS